MVSPGTRPSSQALPAGCCSDHTIAATARAATSAMRASGAPIQRAARRPRDIGAFACAVIAVSLAAARLGSSASLIVAASEGDAEAQVQAQLAHVLAVGEVEPQRADGAAVVHADAVAEDRTKTVPAIRGVARVDEHG